MSICPSNKLYNLASEVKDEGMSAAGVEEEGTPAALDLVFFAPGKLTVWSYTFQHFLLI